MANKIAVSFRLSAEAIRLIRDLAKQMGLSHASVVELAIRDLAKRRIG